MNQNILSDNTEPKQELSKQLNQNTKTQQIGDENYKYIKRNYETSIKYFFSLQNKIIHTLNSQHSQDSIQNIPIVCSYADMEFKFSQDIKKDWVTKLSQPQLNLGYTFSQTRQIIVDRIKQHTDYQCNKNDLILMNSMLTLYYLVVTQFTHKEDQVLIFTPTYYRFLFTLQDQKRQIVEYEMKTKQNQYGDLQFYIDFKQLQQIFQQNTIKMIVFANPHNPTGKVWTRQEMKLLAELAKKYNCLLFSDDIFCDCVQNPRQSYTSFLQFPQIRQNLIWASAFGKAFNCSSNSYTYGIIPNKQMRLKILQAINKVCLFPSFAANKLLESCFTIGDKWRVNTIKYIRENFILLKGEIKKRDLKIGLYLLESGFLTVIDFTYYKWSHNQIKQKLESQNIYPTYFDHCYNKRQKQSITSVRINLAMNRQVIKQFIERLGKIVKNQ